MKVAVTGAAGFVGVNLLHELVGAGHDVVALDRTTSALAPADGVTWVEADVLDTDSVIQAIDGAEVVYHLVAMITLRQEDPVAWRVNTEGVANVADAALTVGARKMVHCSSIHSFDNRGIEALDETSKRSHDDCGLPVYDRSKYAGELELAKYVDKGLDAVICNPTGIYGGIDVPGRLSRLNTLARDAAKGRVPLSIGGAFDLVDVRDVAKGLTLAAEHGRTGENYLLSGEMVALHDLMKLAARSAGRRGPLFAVPLWVVKAIMPIAEPLGALFGSDVMSEAALGALFASPTVDDSKARTDLGYEPRPFEETVRDLVAWFVRAALID